MNEARMSDGDGGMWWVMAATAAASKIFAFLPLTV